jgi:hypothetical protein
VDGREDELDGEEMTDDYLNRDFEYMLDGWRAMQQEVIRLREENEKLRAAFRVNMLRAFSNMSHEEIDAEIAAAIRESVDE